VHSDEAGRRFRCEAGHDSDLKPAAVPALGGKASPLFKNVSASSTVWMSHGDEVSRLPEGFETIGSTADCEQAAVGDSARNFYGFQFHPEVTHSVEGTEMMRNFLEVCGCALTGA